MTEELEIRQATSEDMRMFTNLIIDTGRNPGLKDGETYFSIDKEGFFVGCIKGKPVAFISAVSHSKGSGFIGHYFVEPNYRNRGYGRKMFDFALARLQGYNVSVDAPLEMVDSLLRMGFIKAYDNHRYMGITQSIEADFSDIVPVSTIDPALLSAYDQQCFPVLREKYLRRWLRQEGARALAKFVDGEILGFGLIRPCYEGYKIAPLFANTSDVAKELYFSLTEGVPGESVYIDVPEFNDRATAFVSELNMDSVLETVHMYNRFNYEVDFEKVYGVTSWELG